VKFTVLTKRGPAEHPPAATPLYKLWLKTKTSDLNRNGIKKNIFMVKLPEFFWGVKKILEKY
jgi:hypothetical protein